MKISLKFLSIQLLSLVSLSACSTNFDQNKDPFIDRKGAAIEVKVNGIPTTKMKHRGFFDGDGVKAAEADWQSESDGRLCLTVTPKNPKMGNLTQVSLDIEEYRDDRPNVRWKKYLALPRIEEQINEGEDMSLQNYCPSEFQLTPRIKFSTLPPGTYHVAVRAMGSENWDMQEIELTVK